MNHYTIKTDEGQELKIALNKSDFMDSLFKTGGTMDGYITKRTKNNVFFFTHWKNKEYGVNAHKIIFKVSHDENGRNRYQYGGLDFDNRSQREFAETVLA